MEVLLTSILLIQLYFYIKTKDRKALNGFLYLLGSLLAFLAIYIIIPRFLVFDFPGAFVKSLLSIIFMAIYIPLVLLCIMAAYKNIMESVGDDYKRRKKGESVLFSPTKSNIVFWTVIILVNLLDLGFSILEKLTT